MDAGAVLTLDNPPLNVLSQAMYRRLEALVDDREIEANVEIIQTADAREGFAAFIEKRPPQFRHR